MFNTIIGQSYKRMIAYVLLADVGVFCFIDE